MKNEKKSRYMVAITNSMILYDTSGSFGITKINSQREYSCLFNIYNKKHDILKYVCQSSNVLAV